MTCPAIPFPSQYALFTNAPLLLNEVLSLVMDWINESLLPTLNVYCFTSTVTYSSKLKDLKLILIFVKVNTSAQGQKILPTVIWRKILQQFLELSSVPVCYLKTCGNMSHLWLLLICTITARKDMHICTYQMFQY